jgi:hypothetical protein
MKFLPQAELDYNCTCIRQNFTGNDGNITFVTVMNDFNYTITLPTTTTTTINPLYNFTSDPEYDKLIWEEMNKFRKMCTAVRDCCWRCLFVCLFVVVVVVFVVSCCCRCCLFNLPSQTLYYVLTVTLFSFMCMNNNAAPGVLN